MLLIEVFPMTNALVFFFSESVLNLSVLFFSFIFFCGGYLPGKVDL